jgi:hypothetical protein
MSKLLQRGTAILAVIASLIFATAALGQMPQYEHMMHGGMHGAQHAMSMPGLSQHEVEAINLRDPEAIRRFLANATHDTTPAQPLTAARSSRTAGSQQKAFLAGVAERAVPVAPHDQNH